MGESWYKKCMPQVKDIKQSLDKISQELKSITGIKKAYLFGSLANNINKPKTRIKDIDILAKTTFNSEDLVSINQNVLSNKEEILEEEGFDVNSVKFSKQFTKIKNGVDHWAISSDNKLLHWGPIITDQIDAIEFKKEAEKFASKETGLSLNKLNKTSENKLNNWYSSYISYINREFEDMPSGWYKSDVNNIKDIISNSILL